MPYDQTCWPFQDTTISSGTSLSPSISVSRANVIALIMPSACKLNGTETVPALLENVVFDIYKSMLLQSVNEKVEATKKAASKG